MKRKDVFALQKSSTPSGLIWDTNILYLRKSHNTPLLPPKVCIIIACNFSWDMKMSQGKSKTMPMQIVLGGRSSVIWYCASREYSNFLRHIKRGDMVASWLVWWTLDWAVQVEALPRNIVLGKTLYSHSASLHPGMQVLVKKPLYSCLLSDPTFEW